MGIRISAGPRADQANGHGRRTAIWRSLISLVGLAVALLVPRLLIPIAEDFQFVSFTRDGLLRVALAPLILARDANYIYSIVGLRPAGPDAGAAQ